MFDEGEFTFAQRIKITRAHVPSVNHPDSSFYDYVTRIEDTTFTKFKASVCIVHGFS
jgi:hypothetical protein